uniref:Uncharacterized protein n=1 Tax=Marseillevirus LCMAC102 TaxID=2506603 RepID=A0A481YT56_9VIRU|nr:MAG: hypothetical protein LCMAC102_02130 [Marseillevirus LCMAC102]
MNIGLILADSNTNEIVILESTASAVNQVTIVNAITSANPTVQSSGEANTGLILADSNSNEVVVLESTASAINELTITNAPTGAAPKISATGDNTDIGINLIPKGTDAIVLDANTWPIADGSSDQVLQTDGAGQLSFATVPTLTDNTVQTTDATVTTLATIATTTDRSTLIDVKVSARNTGASEAAGYFLKSVFRNNTGTVTQVGTDDLLSFEDNTAWAVTTSISGTNILVRVTGVAATTINWKSQHTTILSD